MKSLSSCLFTSAFSFLTLTVERKQSSLIFEKRSKVKILPLSENRHAAFDACHRDVMITPLNQPKDKTASRKITTINTEKHTKSSHISPIAKLVKRNKKK